MASSADPLLSPCPCAQASMRATVSSWTRTLSAPRKAAAFPEQAARAYGRTARRTPCGCLARSSTAGTNGRTGRHGGRWFAPSRRYSDCCATRLPNGSFQAAVLQLRSFLLENNVETIVRVVSPGCLDCIPRCRLCPAKGPRPLHFRHRRRSRANVSKNTIHFFD